MEELQLKIENFGPINEADINLGKLNIVGGVNGSGKSTATKLLYGFLLAASPEGEKLYYSWYLEAISKQLTKPFLKVLKPILDELGLNGDDIAKDPENNDYKNQTEVEDSFKNIKSVFSLIEEYVSLNKYDGNIKTAMEKENNLKLLNEAFINSNKKSRLFQTLIIIFLREFGGFRANNLGSLNFDITQFLKINYKNINISPDNKRTMGGLASLIQKSDRNKNFIWKFLAGERDLPSDMKSPYELQYDCEDALAFGNVAYIGPISSLDSTLTQEHSTLPYQYQFISKMAVDNTKVKNDNPNPKIDNILKMINDFTGGQFKYDEVDRFSFNQEDKTFNLRSSASGIKQIGILQMLLANRQLNEKDFLIIDEPEVNLHPDWQLNLAEVLVRLVKDLNINLYINSHSPHFIEALEVLSVKYGLEDDTCFYRTILSEDSDRYDFEELDYDTINLLYSDLGDVYDKIEDIRVENMLNSL